MITPEVSLGLAKIVDAPEIAQASRNLIEMGFPWSWTPGRVVASIHDPDTNVLVARVQNRLAGFGIMWYGEDEAHLNLFCVRPVYQRRGIGRRLLQWLEKPALVAGISRVTLEVRAVNDGARGFYERLGYRKLAYLPGYYQGREAAVRMGRQLGCGASGDQPHGWI